MQQRPCPVGWRVGLSNRSHAEPGRGELKGRDQRERADRVGQAALDPVPHDRTERKTAQSAMFDSLNDDTLKAAHDAARLLYGNHRALGLDPQATPRPTPVR